MFQANNLTLCYSPKKVLQIHMMSHYDNICTKSWYVLRSNIISMFVYQKERLLASVAGSSRLSVLYFIVNFILGNRWILTALNGKKQLAAENRIGSLTLAVK